jgi:hypothetical protein
MSHKLPAISPSVQAPASNKPQIPYKKIAKITGVALFALALLAIGFLAVFANTYGIAGKLGALSKLTLPGGGVLMAAGAISLIGAGILIYRACRSGKKPNQGSPQPIGETIGSLSHLENRKTKPPLESDSPSTISSKNDPIPSMEKKPIKESNIPADVFPQISEKKDIQNLKIQDLFKLPDNEQNSIIQNLRLMEEKQAQKPDLLPWISSKSLRTLTLGDFRKFQFPAKVINDFVSNKTLEANAFALLSAQQIIPLLQENVLTTQTLANIFVIDSGNDLRDYSKFRLMFLATNEKELLTKHLDTFPPRLLLLLPAGSMTNFPWERLDDESIVQELLPEIKEKNPLSIYLLKQSDVSIIERIARYLPVEAVGCFMAHQHTASNFPWPEFIKKERFGQQFQIQHTKVLALHLPWKEFVQNTKEMDYLFNTTLEQRKEILKNLTCYSIQFVAPALNTICLGFVNCLDYFTDSQLSDPQFPWDIFINQRHLGLMLAKRCSLKLEHFLWEELAKQNNRELEYALPIDNELKKQRAREILEKINVSVLKELVQSDRLRQIYVSLLSEEKQRFILAN